MSRVPTDYEHAAQIVEIQAQGAHLEPRIRELLQIRRETREGSARHRMATRALNALRNSFELAGPIIEDLDPIEWGGSIRDV